MNEHDDAYVDAMLMVNMQANTKSVTACPRTKRALFSPRFYFQPGLKVHELYLSSFFLTETEPIQNSVSFISYLFACHCLFLLILRLRRPLVIFFDSGIDSSCLEVTSFILPYHFNIVFVLVVSPPL